MSHNSARGQRTARLGAVDGTETAADAAEFDGARGPQANVDVYRDQHS